MNLQDYIIKSLIVSVFGVALMACLRRSSAAARHLALLLTLVSVCALPAIKPLLPTWQVPFLQVDQGLSSTSLTIGPSTPSEAGVRQTATSIGVESDLFNASLVIPVAWLVVALALLTRVGTKLLRLRRLESQLPMIKDPQILTTITEICRRERCHFLMLEGERDDSPMTWGLARPVLLLPSSAVGWPQDRVRSVLFHELAHVQRRDWSVSIATEIVCAVVWFNPLVWVIRSRMEMESEAAADDLAIAMGVPRTEYATHLVDLIRENHQIRRSANVALAIAKPGRLDLRIRSILAEHSSRSNHGRVRLGLIAAVGAFSLIVATAGPRLLPKSESVVNEFDSGHPSSSGQTSVVVRGGLVDPSGSHRVEASLSGASAPSDPSLADENSVSEAPNRRSDAMSFARRRSVEPPIVNVTVRPSPDSRTDSRIGAKADTDSETETDTYADAKDDVYSEAEVTDSPPLTPRAPIAPYPGTSNPNVTPDPDETSVTAARRSEIGARLKVPNEETELRFRNFKLDRHHLQETISKAMQSAGGSLQAALKEAERSTREACNLAEVSVNRALARVRDHFMRNPGDSIMRSKFAYDDD